VIGWLLALPWVRRLWLWLAAVCAFLAALAALRRSGERSGRLQEQLKKEREVSLRSSECWMRRAIVLGGVMISVGACSAASFERTGVACVPVPEYRQEFLDGAAGTGVALRWHVTPLGRSVSGHRRSARQDRTSTLAVLPLSPAECGGDCGLQLLKGEGLAQNRGLRPCDGLKLRPCPRSRWRTARGDQGGFLLPLPPPPRRSCPASRSRRA